MNDILNYIEVNELISTSGQPSVEQFKQLKEEGVEVIINLALYDANNAIEDQDKVVSGLGMSYFHIPVDFDEPKISDLKLFINILQSMGANKVLVHCAKNYRVTAFMYVYHKYVLHTPFDEVDLSIFDEWSPSQAWREIMKITFDELEKA